MVRITQILTVLFACVMAIKGDHETQRNISHFKDDIAAIPGLKKDVELFGHCMKETTLMYDHQVEAAKKCRDVKDYRCYQACKMENMGITEPNGTIIEKKLLEHFEHKLKNHGNKITVEYKAIMMACMMDTNGKLVVLSKDNCDKNEAPIKCAIEKHYKVCHTKEEKCPEVPKMLP